LRQADACDSVILSSDGSFEWKPKFTFDGSQYAAVDGWIGDLSVDDTAKGQRKGQQISNQCLCQ
jgi:hypothetical protein